MVHIKRSVGYVQIALGIMLIFACFVASDFLFDQVKEQYSTISGVSSKISGNQNITFGIKEKISNIQLMMLSIINTRITIQTLIVIVFILAIMMTLQGVANTRTGSDEDVSPKELRKFIMTLILILYVMSFPYIIIFKTSGENRLIIGIIMLIVLLVVLGILYLIKHILERMKEKKGKLKKSGS